MDNFIDSQKEKEYAHFSNPTKGAYTMNSNRNHQTNQEKKTR